MNRDDMSIRPDLHQAAWVIGKDNCADLAWAYPDSARAASEPIDLTDLPTQAPWDLKRQLWMVHGDLHPATVEGVIARITPCSQVVLLDPHPTGQGTSLDAQGRDRVEHLIRQGRLHLVLGGNMVQRSETMAGLIDIDAFDGWKPVLSRQRLELDPQGVRDVLRLVSTNLNTRVMLKSTKIQMATRFLTNALLNAPWVRASETLAPSADSLSNRPALVVSAGPSLTKQLPILAANQDLFTLFAVDTVWPILHAHGIVPDYLVALDPVTPPPWPRNGLSPQTRFVTDVIVRPEMVWSHDRGHIMTSAHDQLTEALGYLGSRPDGIGIGASVATLAFNMAVHMGANPIVLIGQDLALTGGKDHADGYLHTYDTATLENRSQTGYDVDGYYGGTVRTERQLLVYKSWFEARIRELPDRMVINATEGGARIEGSLQLPFAQVCEQIRMTSLRKPAHPPAPPVQHDPAHIATLRTQLASLVDSIHELRSLAQRAEDLTHGKKAATGRGLSHIDRINEQLRQFHPQAKLVVDALGAGRMEAIRYQTIQQEREERSMTDALRRYREVYRGIQDACDVGISFLEKIGGLYRDVEARGWPDPDLLEAFLA